MTQDVLLRRGSTATLLTTALSALTLPVAGASCTSSLGTATVSVIQPMSVLVDAFDGSSLNTDRWVASPAVPPTGTSGTVTVGNGVLVLTPDSYGDLATSAVTAGRYDLTGGSLVVQAARVPSDGYGYLDVRDSAGVGYLVQVWSGFGAVYVGIARATSAPTAGYYNGTELWSGAVATYNASTTNGCWLRIRESGGTVAVDTAPLTASNPPVGGDWTQRASETMPVGWGVTSLQVRLTATSEGGNQPISWDAVNTTATEFGAPGDQDVRVRVGPGATVVAPVFNADVNSSVLLDQLELSELAVALGQVVVRADNLTRVPVATSLLAQAAVETNYAHDAAITPDTALVTGTPSQPAAILGDTSQTLVVVATSLGASSAVGTPAPVCTALTVIPAGVTGDAVLGEEIALLRVSQVRNLLLLRQPMSGAD